jgi:sugar phosphate isomerase/epimerase
MKFAINYSEASDRLLDERRIEIDLYKSPDWPTLIARCRKRKPVYVHFAMQAGKSDFGSAPKGSGDVGGAKAQARDATKHPAAENQPVPDPTNLDPSDFDESTDDLDRVDRLARETETPFINVHLSPKIRDFPPGVGANSEASAPGAVTDRMISDVARLAARFGAGRVIAENIPLGNPEEGFAPACAEPAAIRRVLDAAGCGFLLDLSHARLTARVLGVDEREYISRLPVDRIRELHLTGIQPVDGRLRDHMHLSDEDWSQTQWALDRIRRGDWGKPTIVALEYGGVGEKFAWRSDAGVIAEQVPRLYEMVHAAG